MCGVVVGGVCMYVCICVRLCVWGGGGGGGGTWPVQWRHRVLGQTPSHPPRSQGLEGWG